MRRIWKIRMNKNVLKGIVIGLSVVLLSVIGMYIGLAFYYADGFSYGTWINGIYCTGKSINEVNEELLHTNNYEGLTITDCDGKSYAIYSEDIDLTVDYERMLEKFLDKQNPYLWIDNLVSSSAERKLLPEVHYNEQAFNKQVNSLPFLHGKKDSECLLEMQKGENGYYLINERQHVLDEEKVKSLIKQAIEELIVDINLEVEGCYRDLPLTDKMEKDIWLWQKIEKYQDCKIVYQFGEENVPIDGGVVCEWISFDEDGDPILDDWGEIVTDEAKVYEYVNQLADEYDTVGGTRQFHATRGEVVSVKGGVYGNKIDRDEEKSYLLAAFLDKKEETHIPVYTQMAIKQGKDDIGDTYIEVDMTEQMLYYYVDGVLEIETPVVTGNTSLRRGTPEGTNFVYMKQKNRILRGEDYASPVKFWIPVKGAIGIHDASWRSKYGGEIYKTNGSHGCINTPLEEVSKLYDMVEIGTPCVMFY